MTNEGQKKKKKKQRNEQASKQQQEEEQEKEATRLLCFCRDWRLFVSLFNWLFRASSLTAVYWEALRLVRGVGWVGACK